MLPVSPVFHTEATVRIGLKNALRVGTSILYCYKQVTRFKVDSKFISKENSAKSLLLHIIIWPKPV